MKPRFKLLVLPLLPVLLLVPGSQAQVESSISPMQTMANRADGAPAMLNISLSGKVQVQGTADLTRDTEVLLECGSTVRASSHVDNQGRFSIFVGGSRVADDWSNVGNTEPSLANCNVFAQAPGYRSAALNLAGEHGSGIIQVGILVLKPLSGPQSAAEGFTVSVASLAAPDKAKQQFEKGREQEKKGKWAAAAEYFRKAIQVYPRYAIAWLELGRTQVQQNNFAEAQQSFQQAASHDSKLLPAYFELARLQAERQEWKALAETTGTMVQLAPDSSAMFWFLDSAANYNLQDFTRAETSATRGLRLDPGHRVPQLEYLYGLILGHRQDYSGAVLHIKTYLQLVPHATDRQNAQEALSDYERLAANSPTAAER